MPEGERPESGSVREDVPTAISSNVLTYILSRQDLPERLMHLLRGNVYDFQKKKYVKRGDPLMNEKGIRWVGTFIDQYLGVDKIVTDISEEELKRICRDVRFDVVAKFYISWEMFDVKKSDLTPIVDIIDHFVFMNLSASRNATLLEFMKPTYKRLETYRPEQKKKRLMGIFPMFGGGEE